MTVSNRNATQNIWAVGRNYAAHAKEMKADVPTTPFFFLKSGNCLQTDGSIRLPLWSKETHYELELALKLDNSLNFSQMTLALDLTARDAQNMAKAKGLPWTLAKSFTGACPIGPWLDLGANEKISLTSLSFQLFKNETCVQRASLTQMIFGPAELLQELKNHYPLSPGDVVLTGTPEGVGPLTGGDVLRAVLQREEHTLLTCHWAVL